MAILFALLAMFQIKHWLCDYPLQTPYMLGKFKSGWAWVLPLAFHAGVHAFGTLMVIILFSNHIKAIPTHLAWFALLDFCVHFVVDRIKAAPALGGRWKPDSKYFWWALGADQSAHHLTHYFIVWRIMSAMG